MDIDSLKDVIKDSPISEILGHYMTLQRAGSGLKGLCPFHQDKKPSLMVSDQKGLFKCFSCDIGGDAILFVQKFKNYEFLEALKEIAQVMSIEVQIDRQDTMSNKRTEAGIKFSTWAIKLYRENITDKKLGKIYFNFLKNRGFSEEIATKFQLGIAPSYDYLTKSILRIPNREKKEQVLEMAISLGFVKKSYQDDGHYDVFKSRVIIPIWNKTGKIVGLTSRGIDDSVLPKYLNSKESFLFNKKHLLYSYHLAKETIREKREVILVEGHLDVVSMYAGGFKQTLGLMGLALNELLLKDLVRWTDRIYLMLDNDDAGQTAIKKILALFFKMGKVPLVPYLGKFKDPDELLQSDGDIVMREALIKAPSGIDWLMDREIPKVIPKNTDKRLEVLGNIFESLSPLKENILAFEKIIQSANRLELETPRELILENYKTYLKDARNLETRKSSKFIEKTPSIRSNKENSPVRPTKIDEDRVSNNAESLINEGFQLTVLQKKFISALFTYPEFLSNKVVYDTVEGIAIPEVKSLIDFSRKLYQEGDSSCFLDNILSYVSRYKPALRASIGAVLFDISPERSLADDLFRKEKLFKDLYLKLCKEHLLLERRELRKLFLIGKGEEAETNSLIRRMSLVEEKIRKLFP